MSIVDTMTAEERAQFTEAEIEGMRIVPAQEEKFPVLDGDYYNHKQLIERQVHTGIASPGLRLDPDWAARELSWCLRMLSNIELGLHNTRAKLNKAIIEIGLRDYKQVRPNFRNSCYVSPPQEQS